MPSTHHFLLTSDWLPVEYVQVKRSAISIYCHVEIDQDDRLVVRPLVSLISEHFPRLSFSIFEQQVVNVKTSLNMLTCICAVF